MSSTSFPASADSASDSKEQADSEPLHSAKSTHTAEPCSESTGLPFPSSRMSEPSPQPTLEGLTLFLEDSPVKTSATLASAQGSGASAADYGETTPAWLTSFDRDTSSWKTSQYSLEGGLSEFSETWPRSGLMLNGTAFQLPPLVPLTVEIVSGFLPTPMATDYMSEHMTKTTVLKRQAASKRGVRVAEVFHRMAFAPTPNAGSDHWGGRLDELGGSSNPFRGTELGKLPLNPCWQEERMGFPIDWTALDPSETPSSRRSQKSSGGRSSKRKA